MGSIADAKAGCTCELLESQAERSEGLDNCWQRAQIGPRIKRWRDEAEAEGYVRWLEVFSQALQPERDPAFDRGNLQQAAERLAARMDIPSATLSVKGDFSHYTGEMGLEIGVVARGGPLGKSV